MANLASAVWQDGAAAMILALHPGCYAWIPDLLSHPNGACVVMTDGGAPNGRQRELLRKHPGSEALDRCDH